MAKTKRKEKEVGAKPNWFLKHFPIFALTLLLSAGGRLSEYYAIQKEIEREKEEKNEQRKEELVTHNFIKNSRLNKHQRTLKRLKIKGNYDLQQEDF